jgi:hypothetical protein
MIYNSTEAKVFKEGPFDEMMVAIIGQRLLTKSEVCLRSIP